MALTLATALSLTACAAPAAVRVTEEAAPLAAAAAAKTAPAATAGAESAVEAPAVDLLLLPEASGTQVRKNDQAEIDYSHPEDGYVMVRYPAQSDKRIKVQVKGPSTTYTYNLTPGSEGWTTFPLSDGNGWYQVVVYRNISGTKYSQQLSAGFQVALADEFAPYLRPNQYVDYSGAEKTVAKAAELVKGKKTALEQVDAIYQFVVKNLSYDYIKAQNVKSGYLPVLDTVLEKKKGICFDYAALMTGMLRSQGIPCKLVVGYAGSAYHAWISVWTEETGWLESTIYFDGQSWQRMDPTFASTGGQSAAIMKYIGDGKNYSVKYLY